MSTMNQIKQTNPFYKEFKVFPVAKIAKEGDKIRIEYLTMSSSNFSSGIDTSELIPVNSAAKEMIEMNLNKGNTIYLDPNYLTINDQPEILPIHLSINTDTSLTAYAKNCYSFIKAHINPQMASAHASVVYGFITLNNKFLEQGFVFSEERKSLVYLDILDKCNDLKEESEKFQEIDQERAVKLDTLSDELLQDLENYISYADILKRSNFCWTLSEDHIAKIEDFVSTKPTVKPNDIISVDIVKVVETDASDETLEETPETVETKEAIKIQFKNPFKGINDPFTIGTLGTESPEATNSFVVPKAKKAPKNPAIVDTVPRETAVANYSIAEFLKENYNWLFLDSHELSEIIVDPVYHDITKYDYSTKTYKEINLLDEYNKHLVSPSQDKVQHFKQLLANVVQETIEYQYKQVLDSVCNAFVEKIHYYSNLR